MRRLDDGARLCRPGPARSADRRISLRPPYRRGLARPRTRRKRSSSSPRTLARSGVCRARRRRHDGYRRPCPSRLSNRRSRPKATRCSWSPSSTTRWPRKPGLSRAAAERLGRPRGRGAATCFAACSAPAAEQPPRSSVMASPPDRIAVVPPGTAKPAGALRPSPRPGSVAALRRQPDPAQRPSGARRGFAAPPRSRLEPALRRVARSRPAHRASGAAR